MIVTEHVEEYINSMEQDLPDYLAELEAYANENGVPIIRRSMQTFLKFLLIKDKPKRILEIGAAIGFSSLYMKEYAPADCRITTIEKVEMRLEQARKNLRGKEGIELIEGDATEVLRKLADSISEEPSGEESMGRNNPDKEICDNKEIESDSAENNTADKFQKESGRFDWVFLDAAKGQYQSWLPDILKLLKPGGMLITDNVLLEGTIAESKFSIERRDRTIHMRMREYLYELTHREDLETVILPVGDGVSLSIKKV